MDLTNYQFLMFELNEIANNYEREGREVIRMTLGKSDLLVNEKITRAMADALQDPSKCNLVYPAGLPELRNEIAQFYSKQHNINIGTNQIVVASGTSNIFRNLFQLLLQEGDECLLPLPYYSLYFVSALILAKIKIKFYNIDLNTLRVDLNSFAENMSDRTKIVVINSPGNPLGNVLSEPELKKIDSIVNGRATIISDEIYENMCFNKQCLSILSIPDFKSPYIITNACSKAYRMYARRVGWCVVKDNPNLVKNLTILQEHTALTADPIVQYGAIEALRNKSDIETIRRVYKDRCDYAVARLNSIPNIKVIVPEGGFYMTIDCTQFMRKHDIQSTRILAKDIIKKILVAIVPGSDFGLPNTIRLSFSAHKFKHGIDLLCQYWLDRISKIKRKNNTKESNSPKIPFRA